MLINKRRRCSDPGVQTGIARLSAFIRGDLGVAGVTDSEVLEAFGVMKTNCVGVTASSDKNVLARAVYPVAALINHSCVPNLDPLVQAAGNFGFKVSTLTIAHKISHRTNVVVVNNQSANSKNFLLLFDWMLTTTTFVLWDILWAMILRVSAHRHFVFIQNFVKSSLGRIFAKDFRFSKQLLRKIKVNIIAEEGRT